ncbi:PilW family protein [Ramlibacter ginsenosidimutans]|uniref:PilW family protein n=1 Tax=Ramlibacter ginsenosidimutans TaxID=502333 RepID=A0A934TWG4_9BURK|nr:PilW family protein [Ramlibacter ginsenosidimutans]MBK6008753.1 PilW family protein [Ramlibacter ginsenosidimutans]
MQAGFTLVELMVGMLISLLVVLAAMSMAQFFMQTQRQATGVGSATANGLSALQAVKYEASQAGLGFSIGGYIPCTQLNFSIGNKVIYDNTPLLPIAVSTASAKSTVTFTYGTALEAATANFTRSDQTSADTSMELTAYTDAQAGQAVMIAPPVGVAAPCTVRTVTGVVAPSGPIGYQLQFDATGTSNQKSFSTTASYADNSQVFLLGQLRQTVFTVNGTDLVMQRPFDSGSPSAVLAHDVVAFLVQYGNTDGLTQSLQGWQTPTGSWAAPSSLQISRVHALQIGVLVRSSQKQKPKADGSCDATVDTPVLMGQNIALTAADWQCYRYRAITSIVPLRNMVLGSST